MKEYRKGTFGVIINDYTFKPTEQIIEKITGDGHHTFNYHGKGKITESLVNEGVVEGHLDKYRDGNSYVIMCEPRQKYFSDADINNILAIWQMEVGMPYSHSSNFATIIPILKYVVNKRSRRCSWHTASGYSKYYTFLNKPPSRVTPYDIRIDMQYTNWRYFDPYPLKPFSRKGEK